MSCARQGKEEEMKHMDFSVLTVGVILLSVFGLCLLPFLCAIQYVDSVTGFSMGSGLSV